MKQQDAYEQRAQASRQRVREALGPCDRFRVSLMGWIGSSSVAYYGDGHRWWHRGHSSAQRAWLAAIPVVWRAGLIKPALRLGKSL